jgi:hypothetical protein
MMSNKQYMRLDDLPGLGNLPQAENKQAECLGYLKV